MLFKIFNFKTIMFFLVLGISIFLYKYLVSTRPEAKPSTVEEKTFYVNVISPKRNNYSPTSDAYGKIISSRSLAFLKILCAKILKSFLVVDNI